MRSLKTIVAAMLLLMVPSPGHAVPDMGDCFAQALVTAGTFWIPDPDAPGPVSIARASCTFEIACTNSVPCRIFVDLHATGTGVLGGQATHASSTGSADRLFCGPARDDCHVANVIPNFTFLPTTKVTVFCATTGPAAAFVAVDCSAYAH